MLPRVRRTAPSPASRIFAVCSQTSSVMSSAPASRFAGESREGKGGVSPARLLKPTVADSLKAGTGGRGKVVALSLKNRGAALPGGKSPDACYWMDGGTGQFVTSTYYRDGVHLWVAEFNKSKPAERWHNKTWDRLRADLDYAPVGRHAADGRAARLRSVARPPQHRADLIREHDPARARACRGAEHVHLRETREQHHAVAPLGIRECGIHERVDVVEALIHRVVEDVHAMLDGDAYQLLDERARKNAASGVVRIVEDQRRDVAAREESPQRVGIGNEVRRRCGQLDRCG